MAFTFNHFVVVCTFGLLLSAPVSQRARTIMGYVALPGFYVYTIPRMLQGIDLISELSFYSAFHNDWRNVIIHVFFVPAILWTAMVYTAYVRLPILPQVRFLGQPLNFAHALAFSYIVFHVACDAALGTLAGLLWAAFAYSATALVTRCELREGDKSTDANGKPAGGRWSFGTCAAYAGALHAFSWYMQLHPGHAVFEGRKPALIDAMFQSFSVAPLFVFYEGAFAMGYRPELAQAVHQAVEAQHAAWAA